MSAEGERSRGKEPSRASQRLPESERRLLMAIFALNEYARVLDNIKSR
jgi:hypothetical protein